MAAYLEIEIVGKESVELLAYYPHLGQESAVLLDAGEKVLWHVVFGEDQGLAAEGPHLGAADVEQVGKLHHVGQGHVGLRAHKAVAQPGPVHVQAQAVFVAAAGQGGELLLGVEGAELRGMGDVHQARLHQVLPHLVVDKGLHIFLQVRRHYLALNVGDGQHPVPGVFYSPGLVDIDMSGVGGDDPLVALEHGVYGHLVGLGAAGEKLYLQVVPAAGGADLGLGSLGVLIVAVAGKGDHVQLHKVFQDLGVGTFGIVREKGKHKNILRM